MQRMGITYQRDTVFELLIELGIIAIVFMLLIGGIVKIGVAGLDETLDLLFSPPLDPDEYQLYNDYVSLVDRVQARENLLMVVGGFGWGLMTTFAILMDTFIAWVVAVNFKGTGEFYDFMRVILRLSAVITLVVTLMTGLLLYLVLYASIGSALPLLCLFGLTTIAMHGVRGRVIHNLTQIGFWKGFAGSILATLAGGYFANWVGNIFISGILQLLFF